MMRLSVPTLLTLLVATSSAGAIPFTEVPTNLQNVADGDIEWVDVDNDGDLDVFLTGEIAAGSNSCVTKIYRNDSGVFTEQQALLPDVCSGDADWADYDHDGDVDLIFTGSADVDRAVLFRNDGGILSEVQELCSPGPGSIEWVNFFGGPRPDIISATTNGVCIMRFDDSSYVPRYYDTTINNSGDVAVADADGDGLDWIARSGSDANGAKFLELDSNGGHLSLSGVNYSSLAFGDLDNDGNQDLVFNGTLASGDNVTRYWLFSDIATTEYPVFHGVRSGDVALGDVDNDGDLDLALFGEDSVQPVGEIHLNNGSGFSPDGTVARLSRSSVTWGDFDADGDLDLLVMGVDVAGKHQTKLFRNDHFLSNTVPSIPAGLTAIPDAHFLALGWSDASDFETPAAGLTYDLRIGSSPGAVDILSPHALSDGTPLLPAMGNVAQPNELFHSIDLMSIPGGDVYWSVQAADAAFGRSGFAPEQYVFLPFVPESDLGEWTTPNLRWANLDDDAGWEVIVSGGLKEGNLPVTDQISLIQDDGTTTPIAKGTGNIGLGDYDNDGDLDLFIAGFKTGELAFTNGNHLFENDNGVFTLVPSGVSNFIGSGRHSVDWGDCDGDGDQDLLLSSFGIYENVGGTFTITALMPPVRDYARFGDFDRDGDLDILVGDVDNHRVYRNEGGGNYADIQQFFDQGSLKTGNWVDIDADGDLDVIVSSSGGLSPCLVYENQTGSFVLDPTNTAVFSRLFNWESSIGDLDHDGDMDLVVGGGGLSCPPDQAAIYENNQGTFARSAEPLPAAIGGSALADYDHDGDLDLLLGGMEGVAGSMSRIRNNEKQLNNPASVPANLGAVVNGSELFLTWSSSTDDHSPTTLISYNVRVGTTPGGEEIVSAMSDLNSGQRKIAKPGNGGTLPFMKLDISNLAAPTLYWSVQSVDAAYVGSSFAGEATIELQPTATPAAGRSTEFFGARPNPSLRRTGLALHLASRQLVDLKLYDLRGRLVRQLVHEGLDAGDHTIEWNGRDDRGRMVVPGNYMAHLRAGAWTASRRLTIMR